MKTRNLLSYTLILLFTSCLSIKQVQKQELSHNFLTEEQQRDFDYNFYEGIRLKEEGQYDEAYEFFEKSNAIDSTDAGLIAEMALIQLAKGNKEDALHRMQQAVKSDPDNWWYNINLINLYGKEKKYNEAIMVGEALLKKYPQKEYVYNVLIQLYKETGQFKKASKLYDRLEKISGINERLVFDKIILFLMDKNFKKAYSEIDKIIQKFPNNTKYKVLKGDMLLQHGKLQQAYDIYQSILEEDAQNALALVSLSEYYKAINNTEKSLEYIIMALKSGQLDLAGKLDILSSHIENIIRADGKIEETEDLFKILVEYYPLEEAVHGYYAAFLEYLKREEEAAVVYESMLNINPLNQQTWLNLIKIYFSKKEYVKTLETTNRAIAATEDNLIYYFYKGVTQGLIEDYEGALLTLTHAVSLFKPGKQLELKSEMYSHLGDIYMKLNRMEDVFASYEEAVLQNPDNLTALNNYAYYLSIESRELNKAERMSAKTVEKEPRNSTFLDTYAWIFYQQGNYSLAKFYIEKALNNLNKDQDNGVILDHYGDILWMFEDNDEKAVEAWKQAYDGGYRTEELKRKIDNKGWER